jgi:hypothetical protein
VLQTPGKRWEMAGNGQNKQDGHYHHIEKYVDEEYNSHEHHSEFHAWFCECDSYSSLALSHLDPQNRSQHWSLTAWSLELSSSYILVLDSFNETLGED